MNRARVASLLRQLADEVESSDTLEDPPTPPPATKSKPKLTEIDRARARRSLRKLGIER